MAQNEIRIPVTIEMTATSTSKPNEPQTPNTPTQTKPVETTTEKKEKSAWGEALSVNLLVDSTKKLLSASGNSQAAAIIEKGMRYGTLGIKSLTGDPTAMITLGIELLAEFLKNEQLKKQEASVNNEAQYNRILSGQVLLGSNAYVTQDKYGNKTYHRK